MHLDRCEIDLNECEHFLKANVDRSEIYLNECEHFLKNDHGKVSVFTSSNHVVYTIIMVMIKDNL